MENRIYAYMVDNEIFSTLDSEDFPENVIENIKNGVQTNPIGIDVTDYLDNEKIKIGSVWNGSVFEDTEDGVMPILDQQSRFVFVSGDTKKTFLRITLNNDLPYTSMWREAFKANVTLKDITDFPNAETGDIWDGEKFTKESQLVNPNSPWTQWKINLGTTRPWQLLMPSTKKADKSLVEKRLSICEVCPELIKLTHQCKKCGCFMKIKAKLQDADCPLRKW